jgi:hypothetical protein
MVLVEENLVHSARSELHGFAGGDYMQVWSIGVLENIMPEFQLARVLSLLHYSTTPLLQ